MSEQKIIPFFEGRNQKNRKKINFLKKMLFFVIVVSGLLGAFLWQKFVEEASNYDIQIPESKNISFNGIAPIAMTTSQIANEFELADDRPVLLYIYTTWCGICSKNFPAINEIIREFQNTELKVITLAIDKELDSKDLSDYLNQFGEIYFEPRFLAFREGFIEFLRKKKISYSGKIPYTVLISREGEVVLKYVGAKNKNYLRNKIISELY